MTNHYPNSVHEALFLDVNGMPQWITVRGRHIDNPVLFIVGGPGAAFTTLARYFEPWENFFTLVQWDQPGGGATHGKNGDAGIEPYTLKRLADDAVAAALKVCELLDKDQIIFLGFSGGTVLGLKAMHNPLHPFRAFAGCGTFVHWQHQAQKSYDLALQRAREGGSRNAVQELLDIGPPPYKDIEQEKIKSRYAGAMTPAEQEAVSALDPGILADMFTPQPGEDFVAAGVEYPHPIEQATRLFDRLRAELYSFDAWTLPLAYEVPMIFIQGDQDIYSVTSEVESFVGEINAPYKRLSIIAGAGHNIMFMRDRLLNVLREEISLIGRLEREENVPR